MWRIIDNRQRTQILSMRALVLAREQEQVTTTQTTLRSTKCLKIKYSLTPYSWKYCKAKISFIAEQATDKNPDYEPSSIYDSIYEDNWVHH